MSEYYQVTLFDNTGNRLLTLNDYVELSWVRTTNKLGRAILVLDPKNLDVDFDLLTTQDTGMVIAGPNRNATDLDTFWFLREFSERQQNKQLTLELVFEDALSLMDRRIVSLRADNPERSEPRSRIDGAIVPQMGEFVENITSLSGFGRDWRNYLTVGPITQPGPAVQKEVAWKNMLKTLQQLARTSLDKGTALFFDIRYLGSYQFQFNIYLNQRGVFHEQPLSTAHPKFLLDEFAIDYNVTNTAWVGGAGKGVNRLVGFAQSDVEGIFGIYEKFKSLNVTSQQALQDEASELVNGAAGKVILSGQLLGDLKDQFGWGDRVFVEHRSRLIECQIATLRTEIVNKVVTRDIVIRSL